LPDREYSIKLSEKDVVTLKLQKIIPKSYDERMGFRGLTKSDLTGMSKVVIMNMEGNIENTWRSQKIHISELDRIKEYCLVIRFEDEKGNHYPVGLSPLDDDVSSDTTLLDEQIYLNAEIIRDRLGRLRYTRVTFLDRGNGYPLDKILPAANKLIDAYRVVSDEYWLNRINEDDILFTSQMDSDRQSAGFSYKGIIKAKEDINDEALKLLTTLISKTDPIPSFHLLLLDAKKALDERNHALAIIYSITALESLVRVYCKEIAVHKGLSNEKFENFQLSTLVTVILRMALSKDKLSDTLIKDFVAANKLRNKIIHNASLEVSRSDSLKTFETVLQFIAVLHKHAPM